MSVPVTEAQREEFFRLYATDAEFHHAVDRLLAGEVADLRAALARITSLRREDFVSGFHYERAVRSEADTALRRLQR